jgi:putative transposase
MREINFEVGKIYHIYNRGVDKRNVFITISNYWRFLEELLIFNNKFNSSRILWEIEEKKGVVDFCSVVNFVNTDENREPLVKILGYCLMPNHFHLILEQIKEGGISDFMQKIGTGYTIYFNKRNERSGSLFQGRFKFKEVLTDEQLKYLMVYVNGLNPAQILEPNLKEEGIKNIEKVLNFVNRYRWSSHRDYLNERNLSIIEKDMIGEIFKNSDKYKEFTKNIILSKDFNKINQILID